MSSHSSANYSGTTLPRYFCLLVPRISDDLPFCFKDQDRSRGILLDKQHTRRRSGERVPGQCFSRRRSSAQNPTGRNQQRGIERWSCDVNTNHWMVTAGSSRLYQHRTVGRPETRGFLHTHHFFPFSLNTHTQTNQQCNAPPPPYCPPPGESPPPMSMPPGPCRPVSPHHSFSKPTTQFPSRRVWLWF